MSDPIDFSKYNLDPSPRNELGKGILDPATEVKLLTDGYIYARRVFTSDTDFFLMLSKTSIQAAANKIMLDELRFMERHQ